MTFHGHHIGYDSLEKMIEATEHCGTIFANCVVESSATRLGMECCSTIISVARIEGDLVHYWHWKIAEVLMLTPSKPIDEEFERRATVAIDTAWPAVRDWLAGKGNLTQASVALYKELKYLDGDRPTFMQYERETARYSLREESHA